MKLPPDQTDAYRSPSADIYEFDEPILKSGDYYASFLWCPGHENPLAHIWSRHGDTTIYVEIKRGHPMNTGALRGLLHAIEVASARNGWLI